jgi:hypothetical protein
MTLAMPDLQPPQRAPIGVIDPIGVAARELALIEALRARPGAALGAIAEAAGHTQSGVRALGQLGFDLFDGPPQLGRVRDPWPLALRVL